MATADAYARIVELGIPALRTSDVASAIRATTTTAHKTLARLARAGLVKRLRPGWWLVGKINADRYALAESITAPFPSYISLQTALYLHGLIDQIPGEVYVVSLGRRRRIKTSVATYSIHHVAPALFTGFDVGENGIKLASREKAVFDMAYFSGGRTRAFSRVPELDLPRGFSWRKMDAWIALVHPARRQTMVASRLRSLQRVS